MSYDRPRRLTDCVDSFIHSTKLLKVEFERNPSFLGIALVVNAAFASEVAMKRHIEITTGKPVRGHKLRELWDQIAVTDQGKLIPLICKPIPLDESRFYEYLDKCSLTFVYWRYMYEKDENFSNYLFLTNLASEVRNLK
jgi:hypothetical protein